MRGMKKKFKEDSSVFATGEIQIKLIEKVLKDIATRLISIKT